MRKFYFAVLNSFVGRPGEMGKKNSIVTKKDSLFYIPFYSRLELLKKSSCLVSPVLGRKIKSTT